MPGLEVIGASLWARAVFHVIAHVDVGALASSAHAPAYVRWAESLLGPASQRALAEDVAILARTARDHDTWARAQAVAWLFDDVALVDRAHDRALEALEDRDVSSGLALDIARAAGPSAEVVRAAAELELTEVARLPTVGNAELRAVKHQIDALRTAAPEIDAFTVRLAPALGLRGRVLGSVIVAGVPGVAGPDVEHVAWQVAHEAIVATRDAAHSFQEAERGALSLLRSRARKNGLAEPHARWFARLDLRALGPIADVEHDSE